MVPRRPREEAAGSIHHVVPKGSADEPIARDDRDREVLVQRIELATRRYQWSCLAYCVLDTHFHLVVATPIANLGRGMQWLLSGYARDFNERHEREGNLFHTRFYSKRVDSDEHFAAAITYVHLNPVRAGIVERAEQWRWSSFASTIGLADRPEFLDVTGLLGRIDEDTIRARLRLQLAVTEAVERHRTNVEGVRRGV